MEPTLSIYVTYITRTPVAIRISKFPLIDQKL